MIEHATPGMITEFDDGIESDKNAIDRKSTHGIRFADSEWRRIKLVAEMEGITTTELVRKTTMNAIDGKSAIDSTTIAPEIVELIKATYRGVYILATLKHEELIGTEREGDIGRLVETAREVQDMIIAKADRSAVQDQ